MLVTSANASTSRKYDASGDVVFLVPFSWRGWGFFVYISVLTLLLVVVFKVS